MSEFPPALAHLAERRIWIGWYWGPVLIKDKITGERVPKLNADGSLKLTKVPCDIGRNNISFKDPAQWRTYAQVREGVLAGVGLTGVGIAAAANDGSWLLMDVDHCRDPVTGVIADWAWGIVEAARSYTEVSPSGTGLRIIGGSGGWDVEERSRLWDLGDEARQAGLACSGETFFSIMYATITFAALDGFGGLWNDELGAVAATLPRRADGGSESTNSSANSDYSGDPVAPIEVVAETLEFIPNGTQSGWQSWKWWNLIGMRVFAATGGSDEGLRVWDEWSAQHPSYGDEDTCENRWEHWRTSSRPTATGFGPLLVAARECQARAGVAGWTGGEKWAAGIISKRQAETLGSMGPVPDEGRGTGPGVDGGGVGGADGSGAFPLSSDEMLARRMVDMWGAEIRYVAAWGKWMRWRSTPDGLGGVWREDATLEALAMARATCVSAAVEMPKQAKDLLEAKTIRATESLARADRRVAAVVDQWDTDPWLLNTPGGVLDLRIGGGAVLRTGDRSAYMTKTTTVAPDFLGECPQWNRFMMDVTGGDAELMAFLCRVVGYCLTGDVSEHALFFLYGTGGNGKGTFMNTLSWILGVDEYARHAGAETFTAQKGEQHLTEIARLRGARMVVTTEVEEGKAWAEARINLLTGGDPVTARFMHQDHFTFKPQFKLLFSGNHKPRIRAVNEATRRRMNLVPFTVTIPVKDLMLGEKLRGEAGAILAWAVRGCRDWQRIGLAAPVKVIKATEDYLGSEDTRAMWLAECCIDATNEGDSKIKERSRVNATTLFSSWRMWAERAGEYVGNQRSFIDWMHQHGFEQDTENKRQSVLKNVRMLTMEALDTNTKDRKVVPFPPRGDSGEKS